MATADTAHPNQLPSELTNIGQLKLVSVIKCLFANINTVANTKYATEYAPAIVALPAPYVDSSIFERANQHPFNNQQRINTRTPTRAHRRRECDYLLTLLSIYLRLYARVRTNDRATRAFMPFEFGMGSHSNRRDS
jgi:hypothetical protein